MATHRAALSSLQPFRDVLDALRARLALAPDEVELRAACERAEAALREWDAGADAGAPPPGRPATLEMEALHQAVQETNVALEEKLEELSILRLVTDATSHAVRAADPFRVLLDRIVKLLNADNGSIMLVDWATRRLWVRTASGEKDERPHMPRFELGEGIAGKVAQQGKPILVADAHTDTRFAQVPGRPTQAGSLLCFPLVVRGQVIGVINLSARKPHAFSPATERIAHIVAGQLAVAIENSRLYDEIKETKDYLENLVERAGAGIFTLDERGLVHSWNTGAREMYCLAARDVIGNGPEVFTPESDLAQVHNSIRTVLHEGGVVSLQTQAQRGDGELIMTDLTLSPIRDSAGSIVGVSGIAKDVSEQKRIEEELRSLNEAKSNFISMVSHELRTPLTSIKSFIEIMLDESETTPAETQRRYFNIINEECDRLGKLITDLLNLQKAEAGGFTLDQQRVCVAEVVRQAHQLYASGAERQGITLLADVRDADPPGRVLGDRDKLYQVLGNLLSNALKMTPSGGRIVVQQDTLEREVRVTVTDTGPGLAPDELERVFEKFYQVDNSITRSVEGTGLGLTICREIVQAHGGRIWVDSEPGRGATFGFRLPRDVPAAPADATAGDDGAA